MITLNILKMVLKLKLVENVKIPTTSIRYHDVQLTGETNDCNGNGG